MRLPLRDDLRHLEWRFDLSVGKEQARHYLDEKGKPMFQDMAHSPLPKGRAGQFGYHLPMTNMLMGYSKNQKAATLPPGRERLVTRPPPTGSSASVTIGMEVVACFSMATEAPLRQPHGPFAARTRPQSRRRAQDVPPTSDIR
jgi:hypothetical protein